MNTNFTFKLQKRKILSTNEKCIENFGMEIPDEIELSLSEQVISKMKRMITIVRQEHLTTLETVSSDCHCPDSSYAIMYKEGKKLNVTTFKYKKSDLEFYTVDLNSLVIRAGADIDKFEVIFTYLNSAGEFLKIRTPAFTIDD